MDTCEHRCVNPIWCLTAFIVLWQAPVAAEKAEQGLYTAHRIGLSYNPLGLVVDNQLFWRLPLSAKPGMLRESAKFEIGVMSSWTPTDEIASVKVTLEPIAFFNLSASAGFYGLFTAFGYGLLPFEDAGADYAPAATKGAERFNAAGSWVTLAPELKLKAGPIVFVNTCKANFISVNRSGYFLEMRTYAMHQAADVNINNEASLLAEVNTRLLAGFVYRFLNVFGAEIQSHRLDAMAVGLFPKTRLGNVFSVVKCGYYFSDPAFGGSVYVAAMVGMEARLGQRHITREKHDE
jgi:hypothetical protein